MGRIVFFKRFTAKSRQNPGKIPARSALIMNRLIVLCFAALMVATSSQECGKRFHNQQLDELQQWIVGGVTAMKGGYPYQVSFEYNDWMFGSKQHICGATIINSKWVITAAHCIVAGKSGMNYNVVVGRHSLSRSGSPMKRHQVKKVVVHPKWTGDREEEMSNDIALIEVRKPIKFNNFVQPACLPDNVATDPATLYKPGTPALISGWGEMDPKAPDQMDPGRSPTVLRAASIPLIEWNECKNANYLYQEMVTKTMTCAGYMTGGIDGCQGDSGGPLVKVVDGKATLIGVVSWGIGCAQPNNPGIYTNVGFELEWIRNYIKK